MIVVKKEFIEQASSLISNHEHFEKDLFSAIISKIPDYIYWLDRNGIYIGCNNLQAKKFGLKSPDEIVGKTNAELISFEEACEEDKINKMVMETRQPYEVENTLISQGNKHSYLIQKIPLINSKDDVIGLLTISRDITDLKEMEELRIKHKMLQQTITKDQEEFRAFTARLAHDIVSPLIILETISSTYDELSERQHIVLRDTITNIRNIASTLLNRYKKDQYDLYSQQKQHIFVTLALKETINQKKYQYRGENVLFHYSFDPSRKFIFINGDQSNFVRMVSNLINNSIEALKGKSGIVEISLEIDDQLIKIVIKDNGKGMSTEVVENIMNNISVPSTKVGGQGIGLSQVRNVLELYDWKMFIESKKGIGTKTTITCPLGEYPKWITDHITLRKGNTVIILDDDKSIHYVWENLLKSYSNDLTFKFFTKGNDVIKFIDSFFEKDKIFLISDYDLRSDITGLQVILEAGMKRQSIIVTSIYNDNKVQDFIESSGIKMFPKQFLDETSIIVK